MNVDRVYERSEMLGNHARASEAASSFTANDTVEAEVLDAAPGFCNVADRALSAAECAQSVA
jgi:hypothetical protein